MFFFVFFRAAFFRAARRPSESTLRRHGETESFTVERERDGGVNTTLKHCVNAIRENITSNTTRNIPRLRRRALQRPAGAFENCGPEAPKETRRQASREIATEKKHYADCFDLVTSRGALAAGVGPCLVDLSKAMVRGLSAKIFRGRRGPQERVATKPRWSYLRSVFT